MPKYSIKELREKRGMTRADVFRRTGVLERTQANAERCPNSMSMSTAVALSAFYGVSIDDIVTKSKLAEQKFPIAKD